MNLSQSKFLRITVLAMSGLAAASAQTQDTSGDGMLKGNFRFRHVAIQNVDANSNPTQITASYGVIAFDGAGHYTATGTVVDNTVSAGSPQPLNVTGTYAIGSNGTGYVSNPLYATNSYDYIYGAVAQGVYTGTSSEAENNGILNDIFIAIPAGTAPTNASFTAPYQTGLIDFSGAGSTAIKNALFELTPNGAGGFGTISLNGQAANLSASTVAQSITGATYNFNSDGSATLTIPVPSGTSAANALFTGSKTIFTSADGNFILGWTASGYDIFFGIKGLTVTGTNSISQGLYFTSALEDIPSGGGTDSYYGATNNFGDANGDGIVHQRLNVPANYSAFDFGTDDQIALNSNGSTATDFNGYNYLFGDGGQAFVAIGTSGFFSLQVGMHAPAFSGKGVFINPVGIGNAATFQPVTASIAPGEMITLFGTGLSSTTMQAQGGQPLPMNMGGVSGTVDSIPCPLLYVSPGQISMLVPYEVASNQTGLANIQVTSNGIASNVVQMYLTDSNPGVYSQNGSGLGYGDALHAATNQVVTASNPAQPGEYLSFYMTGLGTVTPAVADGQPPSTTTLSTSDINNAGNMSVYFNDYGANGSTGNQGTIAFAGLAPIYAGLYQLNVQVPATGLAAGDNVYVEFVTDAADINQAQIPYGSGSHPVPDVKPANRAARLQAMRAQAMKSRAMKSSATKSGAHPMRRGAPAPEATNK